jgi:hypothetical protein
MARGNGWFVIVVGAPARLTERAAMAHAATVIDGVPASLRTPARKQISLLCWHITVA